MKTTYIITFQLDLYRRIIKNVSAKTMSDAALHVARCFPGLVQRGKLISIKRSLET